MILIFISQLQVEIGQDNKIEWRERWTSVILRLSWPILFLSDLIQSSRIWWNYLVLILAIYLPLEQAHPWTIWKTYTQLTYQLTDLETYHNNKLKAILSFTHRLQSSRKVFSVCRQGAALRAKLARWLSSWGNYRPRKRRGHFDWDPPCPCRVLSGFQASRTLAATQAAIDWSPRSLAPL